MTLVKFTLTQNPFGDQTFPGHVWINPEHVKMIQSHNGGLTTTRITLLGGPEVLVQGMASQVAMMLTRQGMA